MDKLGHRLKDHIQKDDICSGKILTKLYPNSKIIWKNKFEKIFALHIIDKELIFFIHRECSQIIKKKVQNLI